MSALTELPLEGGALLGILRTGDWMPHDKDGDIEVWNYCHAMPQYMVHGTRYTVHVTRYTLHVHCRRHTGYTIHRTRYTVHDTVR